MTQKCYVDESGAIIEDGAILYEADSIEDLSPEAKRGYQWGIKYINDQKIRGVILPPLSPIAQVEIYDSNTGYYLRKGGLTVAGVLLAVLLAAMREDR